MKKAGMVLLLCLAFAGCGRTGNMGEKMETEEEEIVTLEFYTWMDEKNYMTEAIEAFMDRYPKIQVHLHLIPSSEYAQTISILHNTDEREIDLFAESKPSASAADVKRGYVADVTEQMEEWRTDSKYMEMAKDLEMNGKYYMIPYRKSTWAVYYNKKIFDDAGVAYPTEDWTWSDYTEIARELTRNTGEDIIYGSMSYETSSMWWRTPVRTAGMENAMTWEMLNGLKQAARWNYQMAYEWNTQPVFTELTDVNSYDYVARFLDGNIGMFYCGDWSMEMIDRQREENGMDFSYDIAPLPGPQNGQKYMPVTPAVLQVSARSKHPKEAFLLAQFLAGEEGANILAENSIIPACDTEETREILRSRPNSPKHMDYFWDYEKAVYTFPNEGMEEALSVVNRYVGQYFLREIGLEEAFENIGNTLVERGLMDEDGE